MSITREGRHGLATEASQLVRRLFRRHELGPPELQRVAATPVVRQSVEWFGPGARRFDVRGAQQCRLDSGEMT